MLYYSVRRFRSNPRAAVHKAAKGAAKVPASDKAYFITDMLSSFLSKNNTTNYRTIAFLSFFFIYYPQDSGRVADYDCIWWYVFGYNS